VQVREISWVNGELVPLISHTGKLIFSRTRIIVVAAEGRRDGCVAVYDYLPTLISWHIHNSEWVKSRKRKPHTCEQAIKADEEEDM